MSSSPNPAGVLTSEAKHTSLRPFRNSMQALLRRTTTFLTPSGSSASIHPSGFRAEKSATELFQPTNPAVDGEECLQDCASCTVELPKKWSIDEEDKLYGHVKGWETHIVVGTGKTDWVRDVTDEKRSLMEEIGKIGLELKNGKLMLSASDMPTGHNSIGEEEYGDDGRTKCLLLPRWEMVEGVGRSQAKWLLEEIIGKGVSNSSPLEESIVKKTNQESLPNGEMVFQKEKDNERDKHEPLDISGLTMHSHNDIEKQSDHKASLTPSGQPKPQGVNIRPCPHRAVILMCSHGTRDWRCGKSAPLLRKEFERHLRPLGLYRDVHDERPGGVGIYFINHVGGHKYSANVMIYRRQGRKKEGKEENMDEASLSTEAVQGIWLARVRPEDCENIVKYTVLQGKLVKPLRQLRGGFDRERGLLSW